MKTHKRKPNQLGSNGPSEHFEVLTFVRNGITFLPHYRNRHVFVGPGYPRFTQQHYSVTDLVNAGAKEDTEYLWQRSDHGVVSATQL